jgi:hypothetical protein
MTIIEPSDAYSPEPATEGAEKVWNKLALTAFFIEIGYTLFVLSCFILHASFAIPLLIGVVTILGIVLGHISLTKPHRQKIGRGYGIAAIVIGYIYVVLALAETLFAILLLGVLMAGFSGG